MSAVKSRAILVAVAIALSASACSGTNGAGVAGGAKDGKVTLRWSTWGSAEDMEVFKAFTEDFTKRHPNIALKLEPVASYEDYHPKLLTQLTSKTAPDVFYVGDDYIGKLVADGVLSPLDEQLAGPSSRSRPRTSSKASTAARRKAASPSASRTTPTPRSSGTTRRPWPPPGSPRTRPR